jgi:phosphoglycerate dehydrogenase-like enzyme
VTGVAHDAAAVVAQYATISARVIAELPECRVIARYGTGVDIVDVDAATRHNVLVTNVPRRSRGRPRGSARRSGRTALACSRRAA